MKQIFHLIFILMAIGCKNNSQSEGNQNSVSDSSLSHKDSLRSSDELGVIVNPIEHASMVLQWENTTVYIDPVGGKEPYSNYAVPDLVLITDIHGDHLDIPTLTSLVADKTEIIAPQAVFEKLSEELKRKVKVLNNGESTSMFDINIEAIPMYNLRKEALQFHPKGRGNGYVLEKNGERIYISGDTEDIPEMRSLKNIDIAFICMNLPYTMTVEKAAEAVLAFKPKLIYPYHFRGKDGFSDVKKFKELVEKENPEIKVVQLDWYPK